MSSKTSCNVVVIGGGSAALEAAIAAKQSGAETVVMVEKAPKHESGGNAQFSHVGFRFVHSGAQELREFMPQVPEERFRRLQIPVYSRQNFIDDLNRVTQGRIDPVLGRLLQLSIEMDTAAGAFDPAPLLARFPGKLTRLEELAASRRAEARQ